MERIEERLAELKRDRAITVPAGVDLATLEVLDATIGIQSLEFWLPEPEPAQTAAQIHFALFSQWIEAGFTRDDALHLLTAHPSFPRRP